MVGVGILGYDPVIKSLGRCLDLATAFSVPGIRSEDMPCQGLHCLRIAAIGRPAHRLIVPCMHIGSRREQSLHCFRIAATSRPAERTIVLYMHIGASGEQRFHRLRVAVV